MFPMIDCTLINTLRAIYVSSDSLYSYQGSGSHSCVSSDVLKSYLGSGSHSFDSCDSLYRYNDYVSSDVLHSYQGYWSQICKSSDSFRSDQIKAIGAITVSSVTPGTHIMSLRAILVYPLTPCTYN